jgi:hypothetical protein
MTFTLAHWHAEAGAACTRREAARWAVTLGGRGPPEEGPEGRQEVGGQLHKVAPQHVVVHHRHRLLRPRPTRSRVHLHTQPHREHRSADLEERCSPPHCLRWLPSTTRRNDGSKKDDGNERHGWRCGLTPAFPMLHRDLAEGQIGKPGEGEGRQCVCLPKD